MPMASLISAAPKCLCSSSSFNSCHPNATPTWMIPPFSQWTGLKQHLGISISISPKFLKPSHLERKVRSKGSVVRASLFGVGAPEALVIGVVALLVFGPKGLAEVARNLGKTLRAFQPTIKELQEVSREFKSTLEREIGLDDAPIQTQNTYSSNRTNTTSRSSIGSAENSPTVADPNGAPSPNRAYTSEEYLKITEATEDQLKASAAQQQGQPPSSGESQFEPQTQPQPEASVKETVGTTPPLEKPQGEV